MVDTRIPQETAQATSVTLQYEAMSPLPIFTLSACTIKSEADLLSAVGLFVFLWELYHEIICKRGVIFAQTQTSDLGVCHLRLVGMVVHRDANKF